MDPIAKALTIAESEARDLFTEYVEAARTGTHEQFRIARAMWERQHQRVAALARDLAEARLEQAKADSLRSN